jgi:hypothetical protein
MGIVMPGLVPGIYVFIDRKVVLHVLVVEAFPMSILFYIVAACTYLAANWLVLRIVLTEWQAGNRWLVPAYPFRSPVQAKRFLCFGGLLLITLLAVVAAGSFEH